MPAEGPDSIRLIGKLSTHAAAAVPPFDWTASTEKFGCFRCTAWGRLESWVLMAGWTYAFSTAVLARSYSRHSRMMSLEAVTANFGSRSRIYLAQRFSCAGFT